MYTYNWFNNKKTDISILTIWSLFISALIKSFYSVIHIFLLSSINIPDAIKVVVYSLTGLLLALLFTSLKKVKIFNRLLYEVNNKSINDDIFDDVIDYDKRTMMKIYIKSSDVYYIGRFFFREENVINSWISLVEYYCVDKKTNNKLFDPEAGGLCSSVVINLKEVERIEIIYEKDSKVWEKANWKKDVIYDLITIYLFILLFNLNHCTIGYYTNHIRSKTYIIKSNTNYSITALIYRFINHFIYRTIFCLL